MLKYKVPFEFQSIKVSLDVTCNLMMDAPTAELETVAYPALNELTSEADFDDIYHNVRWLLNFFPFTPCKRFL